jgi:uncharacterized protein
MVVHTYLTKKPKNPVIIVGFPGFGLVSTIATEFLMDHLKTEKIGSVHMSNLPPMIAVHSGKAIDPIGIFYNKEHNIVLVHVISAAKDIEWKLAEAVIDLAKQLKAKEIVSLEGIGSLKPSEKTRSFFFASKKENTARLEKLTTAPLKEGIIMGLTGILMLKSSKEYPVTALFAEAHSNMPDSKAAAKVIEVLNDYVGLKIDTKPLIKQAEKFENKLRQLLEKTTEMSKEQKKKLTYVG